MEPPPSDERPGLGDEGSAETYHRGRKTRGRLGASLLVVGALGWTCLRLKPTRVRIQGDSMAPTLVAGDWALAFTPRRFSSGDVVIVEHPERPGFEMVKRVVKVTDRGQYWVEGDSPGASTDSRAFGAVSGAALKAKVVAIYWPKERRRLVR
jgi:nickel-type superoxide dismutase maturation protease